MRYEADRLKQHPPKLAPGETLPTKPVYWLIWLFDEKTNVPVHSRMTNDKLLTPTEAAIQCYDIAPTERMLFWNLTSRVTECRKRLRELSKKWHEAGGK